MALGRLLGEAGLGLVYGGAQVGLMGALADAALANGSEVIGIIPRALAGVEVAHQGLSRLVLVETMHERKALMAQEADAFVALPGGFGTLDEFFEIVTWAQLGIHAKPCLLVNTAGYYDHLLSFLEIAIDQGFLKAEKPCLHPRRQRRRRGPASCGEGLADSAGQPRRSGQACTLSGCLPFRHAV